MPNANIYRMTLPTEWAVSPETFSYSSLASIERCPLQWQLAHSCYGDIAGFPTRPNSAAAEGDIVHRVLDKLFRVLAFRGLPELGTNAFRDCVASVDVRGCVNRLMKENDATVAAHPRGASFRLRKSEQQLVNQVIKLFRGIYGDAVSTGAMGDVLMPTPVGSGQVPVGDELAEYLVTRKSLSELPLSHPSLPYKGIIDLVSLKDEHITIVDFKTGNEKIEHETQVRFYAVLFWRCSGKLVHSCEVRYPSKKRYFILTKQDLVDAEAELKRRIDVARQQLESRPAQANTGNHCGLCDVRQFCQEYWSGIGARFQNRKSASRDGKTVDIELVVKSPPTPNGFEAKTADGKSVNVVYQQTELQLHGPFESGERLRIVRGLLGEGNGEIHLKNWTEVYHVT